MDDGTAPDQVVTEVEPLMTEETELEEVDKDCAESVGTVVEVAAAPL